MFRSIRIRMMLPILVATAGVVILGVLRTNDALAVASAADRARSLSMASGQLVTMAHLISQEFVQTNAALRGESQWTDLADDIAATDEGRLNTTAAIATIRTAAPDLDELCVTVERSLDSLEFVRSFGPTLQDGSSALLAYYDVAMQSLLAVVDAVPAYLSDTHLVELAQSLALIGHLDRLAALQLDLIARSLATESVGTNDAVSLPEWIGEERTRVAAVHNLALASELYTQQLGTAEISNANSIRQAILNGRAGEELRQNGQVWLAGQTDRIDRLDYLRDELTDRLRSDAEALGRGARNDMYLVAALSVLVVGITLVTATVLAIRTSRRLRRTREAALTAARVELPTAIADVIAARDETAVRKALSTSSARVDAMLTPGPDEIGEVAAAFGGVHRQALRLAADQALLRMEVQAMFIALSRRGQTLVQRQIHLIDEFGREEADPDALARLFALDHLAARMRRNEENLLVLAGGEPGRWITRPVAMTDLLRAAAQEIEEYRRIKVTYAPDIAVSASVAGDAIHLLAELLENATTFSPPAAEVRVCARREAEGMTITIEDSGIGMPADKLAEANHRLSHPSALTSSLVGTMGLLVIGRLAERHRLTVRLTSTPAAGTTATVVLPDRLLTPIVAGTTQAEGAGQVGFAEDIAAAARNLPVPAAAATTLPRVVDEVPVPAGVAPPVAGSPPPGRVPLMPAPPVPLPPHRPSLPRQREPHLAEATTDAGLPRRPGGDPSGLNVTARQYLAVAEDDLPDPEAVRARLSSLSQGIAAAAAHLSAPPVHPR